MGPPWFAGVVDLCQLHNDLTNEQEQRMKVERDGERDWKVVSDNGETIEGGLSNAQAWRRFDILSNEPINKRQDTADWSFSQNAKNSVSPAQQRRIKARTWRKKKKAAEERAHGQGQKKAISRSHRSKHGHEAGTFGPAGPCRRIDPKTGKYLD